MTARSSPSPGSAPARCGCEAPSSNTIAAMLAKAPSAVTSRIRKRPSSCSAALRRICAMPAAQHHGVDQHQIERDEDIPADQQPRHQPQRARQQEERDDADRDRDEGARPRIDHADRPRHLPEADKEALRFLARHALPVSSCARRRSARRRAARRPWRRRSTAPNRRAPAGRARAAWRRRCRAG